MLVQIGFKFLESLIEGLETDTGVGGNSIAVGDFAHLAQEFTGGIVLHHHHAHRILHVPNIGGTGRTPRLAAISSCSI